MRDYTKDGYRINKMIAMQMELDKAIYEAKDVKYDQEKIKLAILDEIGEMTHELKGNWCWWKDTQPPVDNQRVLEELVDVWHFTMNREYHEKFTMVRSYFKDSDFPLEYINEDGKGTLEELNYAIDEFIHEMDIERLVTLTILLGYTIEDVFEEYKKKNAENYERLSNGY